MADFNLEETWNSFQDLLNQNNVPEICLAIMGVLTLAMVFAYKDDDGSLTYKLLVTLGVIFGVFMVYVSLAIDTGWALGTLIICISGHLKSSHRSPIVCSFLLFTQFPP